MKCKKCGEENGSVKRTCISCGEILEGYTFNNVTGQYGYRHADGTFTENDETKPDPKPEKESYYFKNCTYSYENGVLRLTGERCKKPWIKDLTEKQCIHAPTWEIAEKLCKRFYELGLTWSNSNPYNEIDEWLAYHEYTVYYPTIGKYGNITFADQEKHEILTIDQLLDFDNKNK